jgi:excisionase family DNA binding protein|tara:strand:+ start:2160 stop:2420 length:261 start_codon:yes stop_codon:yes gene_type:complete
MMTQEAAYVPIEDVANHFSVSISTIRGWIRKNHIPDHTYIKVGNTYRFSIDEVVAALSVPRNERDAIDLDDGPSEIPHEFDADEDI